MTSEHRMNMRCLSFSYSRAKHESTIETGQIQRAAWIRGQCLVRDMHLSDFVRRGKAKAQICMLRRGFWKVQIDL